METKFKVGDRVRHWEYGDGTVENVSSDGLRSYVNMDDMEDGVINVFSDNLKLIEPAPTASPTPDRAMIAAMAMQGILSSSLGKDSEEAAILVAKASIMYADALIAELQRPNQ
jgi:hypothetical protein